VLVRYVVLYEGIILDKEFGAFKGRREWDWLCVLMVAKEEFGWCFCIGINFCCRVMWRFHDYWPFFLYTVDIISAIEFDKSGDHLATGDRGGRVVLFERTDTKDVRLTLSSASVFPFYLRRKKAKLCFDRFHVTHLVFVICNMYACWNMQHGASRRDLERMDYSIGRHPEFRYKTEFQSHEPEVIIIILLMLL